MVIVSDYKLVEKNESIFVISTEQIPCPCCGGELSTIGSRRRGAIDTAGCRMALIIRRLYCVKCNRVHHELPDILVPYKRHVSASIESALEGKPDMSVPADESTINRWKRWFLSLANHLAGCLASIAAHHGIVSVEKAACFPKSMLQRVMQYVGDAGGWLARIVRSVANSNNWVHTRFAFLS